MNFKIGDKKVGDGQPCYIIAEAASNHDGDISQAKKLIETAAQAGCDAVKFQTFKAKKLFSERIVPHVVQALEKYELTLEQHETLMEHARKHNIELLSSPFDEDSADLLEEVGVAAFKISSYEITHLPLLRHVGKMKKPVILSTGMATKKEIEKAVDDIRNSGNKKILLMHCVSKYPTQPQDVNLLKMAAMKDEFKTPIGFSDHTLSIMPSIAAVSVGANAVEKHITVNKTLEGPDHHYSMEPEELKELVSKIRLVESFLGKPRIEPVKKELPEREWRRGLYARKTIHEGEVIDEDCIMILRPTRGIPVQDYEKALGKKARQDIRFGDPITEDMI